MKISSIDNPQRDLSDNEVIVQLTTLIDSKSKILAINQRENLALLRKYGGKLEVWKYIVSRPSIVEGGKWKQKLEHYFIGKTHHQEHDFGEIFPNKKGRHIMPIGKLKLFQSETEPLFVNVLRVGTRRKHVDEIGRVFVKAFNKYWKFPEQVSY